MECEKRPLNSEQHMRAKDLISKIKDLSRLKCHKEMKDTWFS